MKTKRSTSFTSWVMEVTARDREPGLFFVGDQGKKDQVDGEMFAVYLKRLRASAS